MDTDWRKRLREALDETGLTMKDLSLRAGLGETYVRDALVRGGGGKIEALRKISIALGRQPDWLLTGEPAGGATGGSAPAVDSAVLGDIGRAPPNAILELDVRAGAGGGGVPVEAWVSDANGNTYAAEGVRDEWALPATIMREVLHASPKHIRAFEVIGDSMEPRLFEGDRVFIDLRYTTPSPEGIFALWDGYGLVVKRLQIVRGSDPIRVSIISANPSYSPYEATLDEIKIIGRFAGRFTTS